MHKTLRHRNHRDLCAGGSYPPENELNAGYAGFSRGLSHSLSHSLSRREDDLQELQMTFSQLDTFMRA